MESLVDTCVRFLLQCIEAGQGSLLLRPDADPSAQLVLPPYLSEILFQHAQARHRVNEPTLAFLARTCHPDCQLLSSQDHVDLSHQPGFTDACVPLLGRLGTRDDPLTQTRGLTLDLSHGRRLLCPPADNAGEDPLRVQSLDLSGCALTSLRFLPRAFDPATLRSLHLNECFDIPSQDLMHALASEEGVQGLVDLRLCHTLIEDDHLVAILTRHAATLRSLDARGCKNLTTLVVLTLCDLEVPLVSLKLPAGSRHVSISSVLFLLLRCGPSLETLEIPHRCWVPQFLLSLPYLAPGLRTLELTSSHIDFAWLRYVLHPTAAHWAHIQSHEGSALAVEEEDAPLEAWHQAMARLFAHLSPAQQEAAGRRFVRQLRSLYFSRLKWPPGEADEFLLECQSLVVVSFSGCRPHNPGSALRALSASGSQIRHLDIQFSTLSLADLPCEGLRSLHAGASLTDAQLQAWLDGSPAMGCQLQELHLHWADDLHDPTARLIERCGPSLRRLSIGLCYWLGRPVMASIAQHCRQLVVLHAFSCLSVTDAVVVSLCQGCPLLRELDLSQNTALTDLSLFAIAAHLQQLESLKANNLTQLTDAGLVRLLMGRGHRLVVLDIGGNRRFSSAAVPSFSRWAPCLRSLNLGGTRFSASDLCALLGSLPHLESLDLSMQPHVTDRVLRTFPSLSILGVLNLAGCGLTAAAIDVLAQCVSLERLDLSRCTQLDGVSLKPILTMSQRPFVMYNPRSNILTR